jgi:hypothetical protein
MKLPIDNLSYPIKIQIGDSSGSGFLVKHENNIYLVTARHVVYRQDLKAGEFVLRDEKLKITCYAFLDAEVQNIPRIYEANLLVLKSNGNIKFNSSVDLVILKIGSIDEKTSGKIANLKFVDGLKTLQDSYGSLVHYDLSASRKFEMVEITNEVFVLGYPSSLSTSDMKQLDYDAPLARKGIIGGKNQKNRTIILDCPVYGGNSGGLVLEMNDDEKKIHLIGVVVEFVPFVDQWQNVRMPGLLNTNLHNSGYSIALPVDYIYALIQEIGTNAVESVSTPLSSK